MRLALLASIVCLGVGCASGGAGGVPGHDGGGDVTTDAGRDEDAAAPADGGRDGGTTPLLDAGMEGDASTADAGMIETDAGADAGMIATDAGTDAGVIDAGTDAGMIDAGPPSACAAAADGTPCDADGDGCTVDDQCTGGVCVPGPRETCGGGGGAMCGADVCVSTGPSSFRCEASGGAGGSCNDGDTCTTGDACQPDGTCAGVPLVDSREPNDTRAAARSLGSISDGDSWPYASFSASLYPAGDEDWYRYFVSDDLFGAIYPRVDLRNVPAGSDYDLCAYFQCPSGSTSASCESGSSSTFDGLPGCCSRAGGSADESVRINPDCSGADDSGTVYVRVWRYSGTPTCASYTLSWGDN